METMTETGTEKRVDELSKRVDSGFQEMSKRVDFGFQEMSKRVDFGFAQVSERFVRVEADIRELRSEMHRGLSKVDTEIRELRSDTKAGFDSLHRLMIKFFAGTVGSIIAGVVVLLLSHS